MDGFSLEDGNDTPVMLSAFRLIKGGSEGGIISGSVVVEPTSV